MSKKEFITVLIITLIVALVWVVSDLVHTKSSAQNLPDVKQYLDPLDPTFDQQTLSKISSLATPAPAPSGGPEVTPSPIATSSPAATPRSTTSSPSPSGSPSPSTSPSAVSQSTAATPSSQLSPTATP